MKNSVLLLLALIGPLGYASDEVHEEVLSSAETVIIEKAQVAINLGPPTRPDPVILDEDIESPVFNEAFEIEASRYKEKMAKLRKARIEHLMKERLVDLKLRRESDKTLLDVLSEQELDIQDLSIVKKGRELGIKKKSGQ